MHFGDIGETSPLLFPGYCKGAATIRRLDLYLPFRAPQDRHKAKCFIPHLLFRKLKISVVQNDPVLGGQCKINQRFRSSQMR